MPESPPVNPPPLVHQRAALDPTPTATLDELLRRLNIRDWDVLLVGDGSGTTWEKACGWAAVLIDRQTRGRRVFYGAASLGSNNFAECLPYLQALTWFDTHYGRERLKSRELLRVHVVTDSQVIANWAGQAFRPDSALPRPTRAIWAIVNEFRRDGYQIQFHWQPRDSTGLNQLADNLAGLARRSLPADGLPAAAADGLAQAAAQCLDAVGSDALSPKWTDVYTVDPDSPG